MDSIEDRIEKTLIKKETMDVVFENIIRSKSVSKIIKKYIDSTSIPEFIFSGVGKNWYICEKIVKTFLSLGIKARALDCVHALHGDLGMLTGDNEKVVFFLSRSGTTVEVVKLATVVRNLRDNGILKNLTIIGFSLNKSMPNKELFDENIVPDNVECLSSIYEFDERNLVPSLSIDIMQLVLDLIGVLIYEGHANLVRNYVYNHLGGANGKALRGDELLKKFS